MTNKKICARCGKYFYIFDTLDKKNKDQHRNCTFTTATINITSDMVDSFRQISTNNNEIDLSHVSDKEIADIIADGVEFNIEDEIVVSVEKYVDIDDALEKLNKTHKIFKESI